MIKIYLVVVQLVILNRSEMWVVIPYIGRIWGGFYKRVARRLTGRKFWRGRDGVWVYPPLEDAMAEAVL